MRAAELWWLHPGRLIAVGVMPIYASFLFFDFARVVKNVYVPGGYYVWGFVLMLAMIVGVQWALSRGGWTQGGWKRGPGAGGVAGAPGPASDHALAELPRFSRGTMMVLLGLTLGAYTLWFGPLVLNPAALLEILAGQRAEVRGAVTTTPGVTTLTQLGVAYGIAYAIRLGDPSQRPSRVEHIGFALVVLLAAFRAFAWAERLALIEVLVCFGVSRMATLQLRGRVSRIVQVGPVLAVPLLYLLFTASEYFRSWEYYVHAYSSVWAFSFDRLVTYYATATNNGIGILVDTQDWPKYTGAFAFKFAWVMPGLGTLLQNTFGPMLGVEEDWLDMFARPEFNSPTAYFRVVLDFGFLGSLLYFVAVGYLIGCAYRSFRERRLFGVLLYPVFVLFLIESLRYSYMGESRFVPLMLGLGILALAARHAGVARSPSQTAAAH